MLRVFALSFGYVLLVRALRVALYFVRLALFELSMHTKYIVELRLRTFVRDS